MDPMRPNLDLLVWLGGHSTDEITQWSYQAMVGGERVRIAVRCDRQCDEHWVRLTQWPDDLQSLQEIGKIFEHGPFSTSDEALAEGVQLLMRAPVSSTANGANSSTLGRRSAEG